jgi:hypothetical protein
MTLAASIARFSEHIKTGQPLNSHLNPAIDLEGINALASYFSPDAQPSQITATKLRDFLARWYVEKAFEPKASNLVDFHAVERLLYWLAEFFKWEGEHNADDRAALLAVLEELRLTLPRAFEITRGLMRWTADRRGAFEFPEFLTSFEEGGRSRYDIDTPAGVGAIEGHFRVIRVEGPLVEAEHLTSEETIWPIIFPNEVAQLLDDQYIINLELVRSKDGWRISDCGIAYPPRTEL